MTTSGGQVFAELPFTHFLSHDVGGSWVGCLTLSLPLSLFFTVRSRYATPQRVFFSRAQNYRPVEHDIITNHKGLSTAGQPQLHPAPFPTPNTLSFSFHTASFSFTLLSSPTEMPPVFFFVTPSPLHTQASLAVFLRHVQSDVCLGKVHLKCYDDSIHSNHKLVMLMTLSFYYILLSILT